MARQQDPYYEIRPVLESAVSKVATEISKQDPSLSNGSALLARVRKLTAMNNQLRGTIQLASQRRDDPRYRHIDGGEIASRSRFVDSTKKRLDDLEAYLTGAQSPGRSPLAAGGGGGDGGGGGSGGSGSGGGGGAGKGSPFHSVNQRRPHSEHAREFERESLLIAQQNEDFDYIADRVGEMHEHATAIGTEVDDQIVMMKQMSTNMDKLQHTFEQVNTKIGEFAQTKDNCIVKVIIYLSVAAVVLLLLLIFV